MLTEAYFLENTISWKMTVVETLPIEKLKEKKTYYSSHIHLLCY